MMWFHFPFNRKRIIGGLSESDRNELAVIPWVSPEGISIVITVTPVGKDPATSFNLFLSWFIIDVIKYKYIIRSS